jgi:glutaminyl-peptide cyclotransferase
MRYQNSFSRKVIRILLVIVALIGLLLLGFGLYQMGQPLLRGGSAGNARAPLLFDGESAYQYVLAQTALGPRPTGSPAGWATGDLILKELTRWGWKTEAQEFFFKGERCRNIIGRKGAGPVIILGAHYDTRPYADNDPIKKDQPIMGADDGASGVAVLLELAHVLDEAKLQHEVWLAFFDAEDRGHLQGWPFSVGASYMAEVLKVKPQAVVVLDMVGDEQQDFYYEHNSDAALQEKLWHLAAELGYSQQFIPQYRWTMTDDHIPFVERGITAVDIIDFDYPYWHTAQDTADKVSAESLHRIGRVMQVWLEKARD